MFVIDAGYASYLLAFSKYSFEHVQDSKLYNNLVWFVDGNNNIRNDEYSDYKGHRRGKEDKDARERVEMFREKIRTFPYAYVHERLEADDMIALFAFFNSDKSVHVLANDKDQIQIPNAVLWNLDREHNVKQTTLEYIDSKMPKSLATIEALPMFLLYQAFFGDVADNIKRIAPKYKQGYDLINGLFEHTTPFTKAYIDYGDLFFNNLKLVLLPHPYVFVDYDTDEMKFKLLSSLDNWYTGDKMFWLKSMEKFIKPDIRNYVANIRFDYEVPTYSPVGKLWLEKQVYGDSFVNFVEQIFYEYVVKG